MRAPECRPVCNLVRHSMRHAMRRSVFQYGAACLVAAALCACSQESAEEKGAKLAGEKIDMVAGIGNALTDKGGKAAESIASGVGNVVKGVERGALKVGRKLDVDPSLARAGLAVSRVQDAAEAGSGEAHGLLAYVIANAQAEGNLRMFAYDALGREIARSSVPVVFAGDDARYVALSLEKNVALGDVVAVGFRFVPGKQVAAK